MTELNFHTTTFKKYKYSSGAHVKWSWSGSDVYGTVRERSKDSLTADGNTITGDDGENVYKMEEYSDGEYTGQMVAKPESSLNSWSGPQDNAAAAESMTFAISSDQKEKIYSMWEKTTNMSEDAMETWDEAPCSDAEVNNGEDIRDETLMLMGQAPDGWNEESYMLANQHLNFLHNNMDSLGEDAMTSGAGNCPDQVAVRMLNRGMNPFSMMPSGNPNFSEATVDLSHLNETELQEFAVDSEELDSVYSKWNDATNMSASQLETWSEHPCANEGSQNPDKVRKRNMRLLEKNKSDWTQKDIDDAKRTVSFVNRMSDEENEPEDPSGGNVGTCPSEWWISLLNWAYNPKSSLPDGDPNPDAEENALTDVDSISFAATSALPKEAQIATEFDEYGIRKNKDEEGDLKSVDAVFEAMEPGEPENRNGVRITKQFLQEVASKDYSKSEPPFMLDHSSDTLSKVGYVKEVWFSDVKEKLMLMARVFNTGSDTHDEVINRLTFKPPTITDGSVGFKNSYESTENSDGEIELTDGKIREFSTTPFPAGYESGGLITQR